MPFNFNESVAQYVAEAINAGIYPREKSWDYIWDYFQPFVAACQWRSFLVRAERLELTALHIGFYLASWGMFRARGKLYRQNLDFFVKLSQRLLSVDSAFWTLDFEEFQNNAQAVNLFDGVRYELANFLQEELGQQNVNLIVGKLLLGTWGQSPAVDRYFAVGFGDYANQRPNAVTLNGQLLQQLASFADQNHWDLDFNRPDGRAYPKGKVVDMAFFQHGWNLQH